MGRQGTGVCGAWLAGTIRGLFPPYLSPPSLSTCLSSSLSLPFFFPLSLPPFPPAPIPPFVCVCKDARVRACVRACMCRSATKLSVWLWNDCCCRPTCCSGNDYILWRSSHCLLELLALPLWHVSPVVCPSTPLPSLLLLLCYPLAATSPPSRVWDPHMPRPSSGSLALGCLTCSAATMRSRSYRRCGQCSASFPPQAYALHGTSTDVKWLTHSLQLIPPPQCLPLSPPPLPAAAPDAAVELPQWELARCRGEPFFSSG